MTRWGNSFEFLFQSSERATSGKSASMSQMVKSLFGWMSVLKIIAMRFILVAVVNRMVPHRKYQRPKFGNMFEEDLTVTIVL